MGPSATVTILYIRMNKNNILENVETQLFCLQ